MTNSYIALYDRNDNVKAKLIVRHVYPKWRRTYPLVSVTFPQVDMTIEPEVMPIQGYSEQIGIDFEIYDSDDDMSDGVAGSPIRTKEEQVLYILNYLSKAYMTDYYQLYIAGWSKTFTGYITTWDLSEQPGTNRVRGSITMMIGTLVLS